MKYLYLDINNRVSFDEDNYYLNGKPMSNENAGNVSELAKSLSSSKVAETIMRLSNEHCSTNCCRYFNG